MRQHGDRHAACALCRARKRQTHRQKQPVGGRTHLCYPTDECMIVASQSSTSHPREQPSLHIKKAASHYPAKSVKLCNAEISSQSAFPVWCWPHFFMTRSININRRDGAGGIVPPSRTWRFSEFYRPGHGRISQSVKLVTTVSVEQAYPANYAGLAKKRNWRKAAPTPLVYAERRAATGLQCLKTTPSCCEAAAPGISMTISLKKKSNCQSDKTSRATTTFSPGDRPNKQSGDSFADRMPSRKKRSTRRK